MKKISYFIVSSLITLIVLFSGFYLYQSVVVAKPITEKAKSIPQMEIVKQKMDPMNWELEIQVTKPFPFVEQYPAFRKEIYDHAGDRKVKIRIQDHPNKRLQEVWNDLDLVIQEGLALQKYTMIERELDAKATEAGVIADVSMDNQFLYISMTDQEHFLYRAIPLVDSKIKKGEE